MSKDRFTVEIEQLEGFQFAVRFAEGELITDEPPPLGQAAGPHAGELLAAAVANCLTASLLFCLNKSRVEGPRLSATAQGRVERDNHGRLRITHIDVKLIAPDATARCLSLFESYCTVTESVRAGIPIAVTVVDQEGRTLHKGSHPP